MANLGRAAGKAFHYLVQRGPRETLRRIGLRFGRKQAEQRLLERIRVTEAEMVRQREAKFSRPLRFSIAVPLYNTPVDLLEEMIDSVQAQTFGDWELCLADGSDEAHGDVEKVCREKAARDPRIRYRRLERNGGISENSNAALAMAEGDYIALLDHDDLLTPDALYEMRSAVEKTGADFLYSDELVFRHPDRNQVQVVRLKPDYSPDALLTNNYICHLTVFSRELLERAGCFRKEYDGSQDHDLFLRLTNQARGIAHVPKVLYLWRAMPGSVASDISEKQYAIEAGRKAVKNFLQETRAVDAEVTCSEVFPTMYRVRYPIEGKPWVRVIMDARGEADEGLPAKLERLRETAGWEHCLWTVIRKAVPENDHAENKSSSFRKEAAGTEGNVKNVCRMSAAEGDSRRALWQRAAEEGEEEYLLFLSGAPEDAEDGWLREMLSQAMPFHAGAVGAKVLTREGKIRHVGVVAGMGREGIAGRPYALCGGQIEGYFGRTALTQNVAAVTDVLLVSREKFRKAGGFAAVYEDCLFDVDLCLRLLEKGWYNVFTPYARLRMGGEADVRFDVGRESPCYEKDAETFRQRNEKWLRSGDPYFNPNLSLKHEDWRYRTE